MIWLRYRSQKIRYAVRARLGFSPFALHENELVFLFSLVAFQRTRGERGFRRVVLILQPVRSRLAVRQLLGRDLLPELSQPRRDALHLLARELSRRVGVHGAHDGRAVLIAKHQVRRARALRRFGHRRHALGISLQVRRTRS
jgi:hypothetical protein